MKRSATKPQQDLLSRFLKFVFDDWSPLPIEIRPNSRLVSEAMRSQGDETIGDAEYFFRHVRGHLAGDEQIVRDLK